MSVGVGRIFKSVCLFVCLFVGLFVSQHNSKTNDPKVFKLGVGNGELGVGNWDTLEVILFWGSKVKGHRSNNTTH